MSTKEEKPTLAGVNVKTRKRNIVVPEDPKSFADAVILIIQNASTGESVEKDLEAATNAIDKTDELEFTKYGDTLFEVLFAGGRLSGGNQLAEDQENTLATNILAAAPDRESIHPFVKSFEILTRRRQFLKRSLENTLTKLLLSLEFFDAEKRRKIAIATALVFSLKVGVVPENLFSGLMNDRLVAKGTVLEFITEFFREFLAKDSLDDLVGILVKGKVVNRLLDFFPSSSRTTADFNRHFKAVGLEQLVDWNVKREQDTKLAELQTAVTDMIKAEPPALANDVSLMIAAKKRECDLPDGEILRVLWLAIIKGINMTGKNQQQIMQAVMKAVKTYGSVIGGLTQTAKLELGLLVQVQVLCYEDNRLLKLFSDLVKVLYDADILKEDTIMHWYKKGSHAKGRAVFLNDIQPFIKWLEEAEEDDDEEEEAK